MKNFLDSVRRQVTTLLLISALAVPAGAQTIDEFPLPMGSGPRFIAAGPDGKLWFTEQLGSEINRITTAGVVEPVVAVTSPTGITAGPEEKFNTRSTLVFVNILVVLGSLFWSGPR